MLVDAYSEEREKNEILREENEELKQRIRELHKHHITTNRRQNEELEKN